MRTIVLALILTVSAPLKLRAGGSVDWEFYALPILRKHPQFLKIIETSLDVRRVGVGVRVGRDASGNATIPELGVGARIPPFEFPARLKGSDGPYDLLLIIHDADTGVSQPGEKGVWLEIKPKTSGSD